ncbi:MAG: signal peptidase II [Desulfobacterales bacterium]|nr:MAG: signal peptidase II [Desulfobacterales bacterium]
MFRFSVVAGLVVFLDQITKLLVVHNFSLYESREIIPGFFNLTFLTNNGAAFSILAGQPALWRQTFFISATIVALIIIVIAHRSYSRESSWYGIGLSLIAGGAIGNLIDRIRLTHVIDFVDVYVGSYHWPAFNIADSAITVGVVGFMVTSILVERAKKNQ